MEDMCFLDRIASILKTRTEEYLFPCIEDLAMNGLQQARFTEDEIVPCRQNVTAFLAQWSRYAGMSQEQCLDWLTDFALEVLVSISRSGPSSIKHGTKSMTKFIYRNENKFFCGREGNLFHARCTSTCRIYDQMETSVVPKKTLPSDNPIDYQQFVINRSKPTLKDKFREQFEEAIQFILQERTKGTTRKIILELLHENNFKTRTGKPWSLTIMNTELGKLEISKNSSREPCNFSKTPGK